MLCKTARVCTSGRSPVSDGQQGVVDDDVADVLCLCKEEDVVLQRDKCQAVQHAVQGAQAQHCAYDTLHKEGGFYRGCKREAGCGRSAGRAEGIATWVL